MRGAVLYPLVVRLAFVTAVVMTLPGTADADEYEEAVRRAIVLLPRPPEQVVVIIRTNGSALVRERLAKTEGFVTRGERVVYLVREGNTLQRARRGPGICDYALAAIIWHEMAHIEGADEKEAQQREEDLWRRYVLRQHIDAGQGLRYLAALRKRH
jgi:hypothetical protein